jgi:NDP-sugar pyrophosphorylase family protein
MQIHFRIGLLGAGLGSRLKSSATAKPLARLGAGSLLSLHLHRFQRAGAKEIYCALRDELLSPADKATLPQVPGLRYLFVNTESSLHTLAELIQAAGTQSGPILFSMADTVMQEEDFKRFLEFCEKLGPNECAVLVTEFVDDEKPLWVQVDTHGNVTSFGSQPGPYVTSGMYFLQPEAMERALVLVKGGTQKMRNFLANLAEHKIPIKTFVVEKTIDVDHPSDLLKAEELLRGN